MVKKTDHELSKISPLDKKRFPSDSILTPARTATITAAINQQDYSSYLYFLGAMLAIGVPGLCVAIIEAISLNYE